MKFTKQMDRNKILSALFLLALTLVLLAYIKFSFSEDLDCYVDAKNRLNFQQTITQYIAQTKQSLEKSVQNEQKNLGFLQKRVDEKILKEVLKHFMQGFFVKKISQKQEDKFIQTRYYVEGIILSPKNFYEMIDFFAKNDYPIKVEYPIDFKREKDSIKIDFVLTVYQAAQAS